MYWCSLCSTCSYGQYSIAAPWLSNTRICDRTLPIVLIYKKSVQTKTTNAHYSSNNNLKGSVDVQSIQQLPISLGLELNTPKLCAFISSCVRKVLVFFFDLSFDRKNGVPITTSIEIKTKSNKLTTYCNTSTIK